MIEIQINNDTTYILYNLYSIYKYNYKNITSLKIENFDFIDLPPDLNNLEKLYIKNCNLYPFSIPPSYLKLKELYLDNIKYKSNILPPLINLKKLIIKNCYNLDIPEYNKLEILMLNNYIVDIHKKKKFIKEFPNLKFCRIKNIFNSYFSYICCPRIKYFSYDSDIPSFTQFYISKTKYSPIYDNLDDFNSINDILLKIVDENLNDMNDFINKFKKVIIDEHKYLNYDIQNNEPPNIQYNNEINNQEYNENNPVLKLYIQKAFNKFITLYPNYFYFEFYNDLKYIIFNRAIDNNIYYKSMSDYVYVNNISYSVFNYFFKQIDNYIQYLNKEYVHKKKNEFFNFIYEPYSENFFDENIKKYIKDFIDNPNPSNDKSNLSIPQNYKLDITNKTVEIPILYPKVNFPNQNNQENLSKPKKKRKLN